MQLTFVDAHRRVTGARYCLQVSGMRVIVIHQYVARLSFESESVDGIFSSFTLELFDTPELVQVLAEWHRVLRPGGRLAVVAISKEGKQSVVMRAYEWTHKHFPNLMDCRPIFVSHALIAAGFTIADKKIEYMWVPVEIVPGVKES